MQYVLDFTTGRSTVDCGRHFPTMIVKVCSKIVFGPPVLCGRGQCSAANDVLQPMDESKSPCMQALYTREGLV